MTSTREPDRGGAEGLERGECPEQPLVHELADGELSAAAAARARHHLARCGRCRSELAFLLALALAVARGVLAAQPRAIGGPS